MWQGRPGGSPLGGRAVLSGQRLGEAQACTCVTSPPDTRGAVLGTGKQVCEAAPTQAGGPTGSSQGKDPGLHCVRCRPPSFGDCCTQGGLLHGGPAAPAVTGRANLCPPVARAPKKREAVLHRRLCLKEASTAPSCPVTSPEAVSIITKPWAAASGFDCGDEVLFYSVLVEICWQMTFISLLLELLSLLETSQFPFL